VTTLDLITAAPEAVWSSGAGRLLFGGSRDQPQGFAIHPRPGLLLEDGSHREDPILETHPRWTDDGWIRGEFALPPLSAGHALVAAFGFIAPSGAPRTKGVTITISCDLTILYQEPKLYTGSLNSVTVDLSRFAGAPRTLSLDIAVNGDPTQAWLVWTVLRVVPI
jgi:hypothetical protein